MKNRNNDATIWILAVLMPTLLAFPSLAQDGKTTSNRDAESVGEGARTKDVTIGAFSVNVPDDWDEFSPRELAELQQQYSAQSEEIYRQYSDSDDLSKDVDVAAFHFSKNTGTFVMVSFTVPAESDLIELLKSQIEDKMAWGVREGHIREYLGFVSIDDDHFSGFYTKTIGNDGAINVSGGLEHKKLKNTLIQLTLLCPDPWDEKRAIETLESTLVTVALVEK